jgi:hypothetical protein
MTNSAYEIRHFLSETEDAGRRKFEDKVPIVSLPNTKKNG